VFLPEKLPLWAVGLICLSRRVHSIFVLRLFNDCFAMMFLFLAMYLFIKDNWSLGCFFYSVAVSIKMNVLLFAPGLAVLLVKRFGILPSIPKLLICAYVQVVVAIPFMIENPFGYLKMSFDLGRKFIFYWSVNWKFIPEEIFLSDTWGLSLLALTLTFIVIFAIFKWTPEEGLFKLVVSSWMKPPVFNKQRGVLLSAERTTTHSLCSSPLSCH
jgi:alpha-1,3-mannosyltransferase